MKSMRKNMMLGCGAGCGLLLMSAASGGDLNPPGGPVSETLKTLVEVEPRQQIKNDFVGLVPIVISQSGSYYLMEPIQGLFNQHAIEITASDVTLDLNGFTVTANTEVGSLNGIEISGIRNNIHIYNGTLKFFPIGINAADDTGVRVEDVYAWACQTGFFTDGAMLVRCFAYQSFTRGFHTGANGSAYRDCTANNSTNFQGFLCVGPSSFIGCTASNNATTGIDTAPGSLIESCVVNDNGGDGIDASGRALIRGCYLRGNGDDGITVGSTSLIESCVIEQSTNDGITLSSGGSTVRDCSIRSSGRHGVFCNTSGQIVVNNSIAFSGSIGSGANVHVISQDCLIEGNMMVGGDFGIQTTSGGNLIISNKYTGVGDAYGQISGGNKVGTIIVVGATVSTTNQWANLEY